MPRKYHSGDFVSDTISATAATTYYSDPIPIPDGCTSVVQMFEKHLDAGGQLDSSAIQLSLDGTNFADTSATGGVVNASGQRVLQYELPAGVAVRWRGTYSGPPTFGTTITTAFLTVAT